MSESRRPGVPGWSIDGLLLVLLLSFTLTLFLAGGSVVLWLMQSVPLLLLLPGLRRNRRRALQWLGFLLLFNFTVGVLQLFTPHALSRSLGAVTILGCLLLFTAVIVRLRIERTEQPETGHGKDR